MTCQVHVHMGRHQHSSHHQGLVAQQALPWDAGLLCCLSAEGESGSVTQSSFISEQALFYEQKASLMTEVQKKGVSGYVSGLKNHSRRRLENQTRTWGETTGGWIIPTTPSQNHLVGDLIAMTTECSPDPPSANPTGADQPAV